MNGTKQGKASQISGQEGKRNDALPNVTANGKTVTSAEARAEMEQHYGKGKVPPATNATAGTNKGKRAVSNGSKGDGKSEGVKKKEEPEKRGRKSLTASLSAKEKQEQIDDLLDELRKSTDPDDKKRIRRALRARGHRGGLSAEREAKKAKEAATAKAGKKSGKAAA